MNGGGERNQFLLIGGLSAAVVLFALLNIFFGEAALGPGQILESLFGDTEGAGVQAVRMIVVELRLPRMLLAGSIGFTLGLAGAALQGLLRNPLADPGIIGVSASASLGAVLAMYFGLSAIIPLALPAGGMAGALIGVTVIYLLAGRDSGVLTLILAGVAINAMAGALTSLALNLAPSPFAALEIVFWLLGSVQDRSLDHVLLAAPVMLAGWLLLAGSGRALDALTLGDDTARSLGINLRFVRLRVIFGVALAVGGATSVAGAIGFVGLVVPHILRPLVGYQPGKLLFASGLGGAAMLLAADFLVRVVPTGSDVELKLGVLTAIVGAPFFFSLILRTRREMK